MKQPFGVQCKICCLYLITIFIGFPVFAKGVCWVATVWRDLASKVLPDRLTQICKAIIHEMWLALRPIGVSLFDARYSFIPILFVFAIILILVYFGEEREEEERSQKVRTGSVRIMDDSPVTRKEDDELLRGAYVETLGNIILTAPGGGVEQHATYVGVYGKWGDGKTTIRHLLKEHFQGMDGNDQVVVIDFSPWKYPKGTDLWLELCKKLSKAIGKLPGRGQARQIFRQLAIFASYKSVVRKCSSINAFFDIFRTIWFSVILTEEQLLEEIRVQLQAIGKTSRIVVVVDDLDRVTPEEAVEVIRFLKANGDLPNLVYLILAEEENLANAVASLFKDTPKFTLEEGREYLGKIVTLPCPLPDIPEPKIVLYFEKEVKSLINEYGVPAGHLPAAIKWVVQYLKNLRDAKRMLNAYSVVLARRKRHVDGRTFLGVDAGDLLVVTALRLHEPELYRHLRAGMHPLFEASTPEQRMMGNPGVDNIWLENHFYQYATDGRHDRIRDFMQNWLGVVYTGSNTGKDKRDRYKLEKPDSPEDMAGFRLSSRFSFDAYFLEDNFISLLKKDDIEEFKHQVKRKRHPEQLLRSLDERHVLHIFLYALSGLNDWDSWDEADFFMRTLVWMGGKEWHSLPEYHPAPDLFDRSIYERIYECLRIHCARLCEDARLHWAVPSGKTVGGSLLAVLEEENDVIMSAFLISGHGPAHVNDRNGQTGDNLFSSNEFKQLKAGYLQRILVFHRQGKMMSHPDCGILLSGWVYIVLENGYENERMAFQRVFLSELQKRGSAWKALSLYGTWAPVVEEYGAYLVNLDSLERVLGRAGVKQVVATLAPTADTDNVQARTVRLLEWVMERKEHGKPYGEAEQLEYLQHLQRQREKVANLPQDPTSKEESCGAESSKAAESLL